MYIHLFIYKYIVNIIYTGKFCFQISSTTIILIDFFYRGTIAKNAVLRKGHRLGLFSGKKSYITVETYFIEYSNKSSMAQIKNYAASLRNDRR